MKNIIKSYISFVLSIILCFSVVCGIDFPVQSAAVDYVYSGKYIKNWGVREETATFLSQNAEEFYKDNNTSYDKLSGLSGDSSVSAVPSSELYKELQNLMRENHTYSTSYGGTRSLYQYTDCQNSGKTSNKISSFYSGEEIGPEWDYGATWNREHTWPKSKTAYKSVENSDVNEATDIMSLRPTASSENISRSNKAYGLTTNNTYFNPNNFSNGKYDLRGDCARIMLYVYVRWGNTSYMFGSSGVIQSREVLLQWMQEDPVDTWELGRNDSVESITGTRNVFVDYPELAFLLFGEQVPDNYISPTGSSSGNNGDGDDTNSDTPIVIKPNWVVTDAIKTGVAYKFGMYQANIDKVLYATGDMQGYYMATTEDVNAAVDVYLEETADGLYLYAMVGGEKKYMNMVINNQYVNAVYEDAPTSVYVYDETLKTLVTGINNSKYAFGTYNSHTTIGTGDVIKYPDNFFCGFYTSSTDDETPDVLNTTGDVNDDGYTNNRDLAVLMQFINGWEITVNLSVADVNGDGEINNRDYAVLMQFVNGWNVKSV